MKVNRRTEESVICGRQNVLMGGSAKLKMGIKEF